MCKSEQRDSKDEWNFVSNKTEEFSIDFISQVAHIEVSNIIHGINVESMRYGALWTDLAPDKQQMLSEIDNLINGGANFAAVI